MNINLNIPINNTGYGIASINIFRELYKQSTISLFPIGQPSVDNQLDHEAVSQCLNNRYSMVGTAPTIKIWHQFDLLTRIGRGPYFAYPFFELDTFNSYEIINMSIPDCLFVSSNWAKNVIANNNIGTPVEVIPLGVDRNIFNDSIPSTRSDNKYVFLNIGKWEVRKGHDILYNLFTQAFPDQKDVELWILASEHTNNYSSADELSKWKDMYSGDSRIKLFSGVETHKDIAKLISNCDCGLYPSRAEGWNLELLETMSMNKPVIATNYSAHTEFCNKDNSYLIDINETEKAYDGKAFIGQGNWAKIGTEQTDQIIEYMRFVYNNKINTNPNGIQTAKKYSWANSANEILRCINKYS
jgi:glycosyltransferase involved in cell wall biosynthesis